MLNSADQTLYEKKKQANKQIDFSKHPTTSSTFSWSKSTSILTPLKLSSAPDEEKMLSDLNFSTSTFPLWEK